MLTLSTPAGSPRSVRNARDRRLQLLQIVLDREQEALAGFGQRQLPGAALKQPDAEIALQHRDVAADRRRGERKPSRRGREAAWFRRCGRRIRGLRASP